MKRPNLQKIVFALTLGAIVFSLSSAFAAEPVKIEGLIVGRSGDEVTVQFGSGAEMTFILTDRTEVSQIGELSDPRRMNLAMTVLIPGLKVKVEGAYGEQRQVFATSIKFKKDDLEDAQKVQAGMHEVKAQNEEQQQELERQNAELKAQNDALQQHQEQLTEQQQKIEANKAAIAANTARFGQLDDYYIWDEVTVLFGNGQVKVTPQHETQLLALAEKAKTIDGYVIEVIGYASSAGSVALNQKLSRERADNVTNILLQKGNIPLTRMLAPGAMGESQQTGNDNTAEGQAENRRVVVRVLQNKAVAGPAAIQAGETSEQRFPKNFVAGHQHVVTRDCCRRAKTLATDGGSNAKTNPNRCSGDIDKPSVGERSLACQSTSRSVRDVMELKAKVSRDQSWQARL